jgi:hypothetical protein
MQKLTHCAFRFGVGLLGGLLFWIGAGGLASADHFPAEMVSATKHNLAANANIGFGTSTPGSSEVCVFCHTPHGAGYSNGVDVNLSQGFPPLWNRKINSGTAYTTYATLNSPNFEASSASTLNVKGIKGVSLACLSCHDGTIAFDALINLPGSGGYQIGNATQAPGGTALPGQVDIATALFGNFTGSNVDGNRSFSETTRTGSAGDPFGGAVYTNDTLFDGGSAPFPNLTTDLSDDHPISFEIPTTDPQFDQLVAGSQADPNGHLLYLKRDLEVNGGGTGTGILPVDKRDRIRAYPSAGAATLTSGSVAGAYIECASCHNPHTPRTLFLRLPSNVNATGAFDATTGGIGLPSGGGTQTAASAGVPNGIYWSHAPNQGSAICISCHQK